MSIKRRQRRQSQVHLAYLANVLGSFYEFLKRSPQPSDNEVRASFKRHDHIWKQYCVEKQLNKSANDLFIRQVALLWKAKQAKNTSTEN